MNTNKWMMSVALTTSILIVMGVQAGDLTPPSAPGPTMKTLQQIWDKLEAQHAALNATARQNSVLLNALGVELPWLFALKPGSSGPYWTQSNLAFDSDGNPTVAYVVSFGNLKLARLIGNSWIVTDVPSTTDIGNISLAYGPDGHPSIAYRSIYNEVDGGNHLRLVRFNGSTWQDTLLDTRGTSMPSLAIGSDNNPAVAYNVQGTNLEFIVYNGTTWTNTPIATDVNSSSLAFAPDGKPAIAYSFGAWNEPGGIRFVHFDGVTWNASAAYDHTNCLEPSLAFTPNGHPAITFHIDSSDLLYTEFDVTDWNTSTVDPYLPCKFSHPSLAFGPDGQPAIAYGYSSGNDRSLRFASYKGFWDPEVIDTVEEAGYQASLAFGPDGQPCITYNLNVSWISGGLQLKLARKGPFGGY